MPSQQNEDSSGSGVSRKLAGAGVAATAVAGIASAGESSGGWLADTSQLGVDDAVGFASVNVAALRERDDLLQLDESDLTNSWTSDGAASVEDIAADVGSRVDLAVSDAQTVLDASDVTVEDVDRVAAVGSGTVGTDERVGGVVLEGSVDGSDVVDALDRVTELASDDAGDAYDRYSVEDDRLDGDVVVAATDGRVLAGGTADLDADGSDVVDLLVDAHAGDAARFGPESEYAGDVFEELSDVAAVAGVEWAFADDSGDLVPDHLGDALKSNGYLPGDLSVEDATGGIGAAAVGVDPDDPGATLVVAYDRSPPVAAVRDAVSHLEDRYASRLEDVDLSVSVDGNEEAGLLVVEATTTDAQLKDLQNGIGEYGRNSGVLGRGVTWGVIPTLKGAYRSAVDYWTAFVDNHL